MGLRSAASVSLWGLAALLSAAPFAPPPAFSSCGASACEMDSMGATPRAERSARLGYEFEFVPQSKRWSGRGEAPAGVKGGHHDEVYSVTRIHRLSAALGFTPRWSASVQLPFIARSHGHVHYHRGNQLDESWSAPGLGDVLAELRYAFWRSEGSSTWSFGAGGEFPTGRAEAFNAAGSAAETGILPGSGSYDAALSLVWQRPIGRGGLFASVARRFNGPGELGYRLGDVTMAHAGTMIPLGARWLGMVQLNGVVHQRDWTGRSREDTTNSGGEALYASPGLEFSTGGGWSLSAAVQLPLYQRVNGYQIVADYALRTGLGYRFSF